MLDRIEINPKICHGQPVIKGTRIMVYLILELLEAGIAPENIIKDYYPTLTLEDIKAAIHYAVAIIKNQEVVPFTEGT